MHNILISGGTVVDGTGVPGRRLDLAVDGTKIAGLYKEADQRASLVIDAEGMVVCPGFIDIHTHSDLTLFCNPMAESKIMQGVTTELIGNCGTSPMPAVGNAREALSDYAKDMDVEIDWATLDEYFLRLHNMRTSVNVAALVGAETVRRAVLGADDVRPSEGQLKLMKNLVAESMLQGAYGLSSGLIYAPGCYASTDELVALASVSASFGGMYASHIRGESSTLVRSVEEAIRIGREAHVRVEISHHKACGKRNWGTVKRTLAMIESARSEGVDVAFDVYPYTAACTSLDSVLPPWAHAGGPIKEIARLKDPETRERLKREVNTLTDDWEASAAEDGWENIVVIGFKKPENKRFENRSVADIAKTLQKDPTDTAFDLIIDEGVQLFAIYHDINEDDVFTVMCHPLGSIGSDGESVCPYGPLAQSTVHPRSYGTFPRVIREYAIDRKAFPLEEAIRKMTSWPAERIGITDRGVLAKGLAADIVVFDPAKIRDKATFENAHQFPEGITTVIVNGSVTVADGKHTKERAGLVLRHRPAVA